MCGIFGLVNIEIDDRQLKSISNHMHHRGPYDKGTFYEKKNNSILLGQNRLEILDIQHGKQPMISQCRNYIIIFNGEIYNFLELRKELENLGHIFLSSNSDTETLLNGYK